MRMKDRKLYEAQQAELKAIIEQTKIQVEEDRSDTPKPIEYIQEIYFSENGLVTRLFKLLMNPKVKELHQKYQK